MTLEQDAAVVANTAAISLEEIIPVGVSSSATIAPEQVRMTAMVMVMAMVMIIFIHQCCFLHLGLQLQGKKKREDDLMGDGDVNRDERKRRRAKHKRIVSKTPQHFVLQLLVVVLLLTRIRSSVCDKRKMPSAWPSACHSAPFDSAALPRAR